MEQLTYKFKVVYTTNCKEYSFDPTISVTEFLTDIRAKAIVDFNLLDVEIVECGQYDNVNGHNPELAPAIQDSSTQIDHLYNPQSTAFYIRPLPPFPPLRKR
jgi:hypothetical protein